MTKREEQRAPREDLPEAEVVPASRISLVWLIPILALVIGGYLAYKAYSERGPRIQIEFKTAAGLAAGKTKVTFKDVDVGQVTAIEVHRDLTKVIVTAELVAGAERYLKEDTRFWVARARVTPSQVSGLDTLLSGAHIAVDPVITGPDARYFVGLEVPPLFTTQEPGKKFILRSRTLGSLNIGSPVYYRSIQVGQVVGYDLDEDGGAVSIRLFISAPNDRLVFTDTRFWNASGIDFKLTTQGLQVDTQSLLSMLVGGIAFDTPPTLEAGGMPATEESYFPLYASRDLAHEKVYLNKKRFLLYFDGSVRDLYVDAPVMLRGIKVGKVLDVQLQFDTEALRFHIPVLVEIEPERIQFIGSDYRDVEKERPIERLVERGLRAQLKIWSLITGELYVDLDFYDKGQPGEIRIQDDYPVIPTVVSAPLDEITNKANTLMDSLNAFPLEEIGTDLRDAIQGVEAIATSQALSRALTELEATLAQLRVTAQDLGSGVVPRLNAALEQARLTMQSADDLVADDSALYLEIRGMLRELTAAARSLRGLADYLERHPEALVKGKGR